MDYNIKCIITYDGTNFMGYQVQDDLRTVELELQKAIEKITLTKTKIYASGRTDRLVHAKGQVINFKSKLNIACNNWLRAINSFLPLDIKVLDVEIVDEDFHARFSAVKKEYRYYILHNKEDLFLRNYTLMQNDLDIELMNQALKKLIGKHDFKGFCSASIDERKDTIKEIYNAYINIDNDLLEFVFIGNGFLKYQIRKMMGMIIEIGKKKIDISIIDKILKELDPKLSNKMVSGCGLYLYSVTYDKEN